MKIKKINLFDRVKLSLCCQYWNKYDSVVKIKDYLFFIHENMQENVLNIMEVCRM